MFSLHMTLSWVSMVYINKIFGMLMKNIKGMEYYLVINTMTIFGSQKILGKEKNIKKNSFLMFGFTIENIKENQI